MSAALCRQAEIRHDAAATQRKAEQQATRDAKARLSLDVLKPWRDTYMAAGPSARAAILANLIEFVTNRTQL